MNKNMLRKALWEFLKPLIQLITNILNPESGEEWLVELKKFLRKEPCWVTAGLAIPVAREVSDDEYIVRVDRTIRPSYLPASNYKEEYYVQFQNSGPESFDLRKIKKFLLDEQGNGGKVTGRTIFDFLVKNNMLSRALSYRDGEEIQKKGVDIFRKIFGPNNLMLWKSVAEANSRGSNEDQLNVMYLIVSGGRVKMFVRNLAKDFDLRDLAGIVDE